MAPPLAPPFALAAAAAAAPRAAPAAVWFGWSGVALAAYACYWAVLVRCMPRGAPASDIVDRRANPALARAFFWTALAELCVVFVAPLAAATAAPGAAAAKYFLPIAVMTALNIYLEGACRRRGCVLAVYASTGVNNLWRLSAYFAALWELSLVPQPGGAALRVVGWAGVAISVGIILIFEPVVARFVPLAAPPKAASRGAGTAAAAGVR